MFYYPNTAIPYHNIGNMTNVQYPVLGQKEIKYFKSDISFKAKSPFIDKLYSLLYYCNIIYGEKLTNII